MEMKRVARKLLAVCMALALVFGFALAEADMEAIYSAGLEAYDAGDYATAAELFAQAAERGHAGAQYQLGLMYVNGEGVEQDDACSLRLRAFAAFLKVSAAALAVESSAFHSNAAPRGPRKMEFEMVCTENDLNFARGPLG